MPDVPEHITPADIHAMDTDQLEALLEQIRERRLSSVRAYEQAVATAKEASDAAAAERLMKECAMCANNITRVNKALDALEIRVNKMRALRLELGLD